MADRCIERFLVTHVGSVVGNDNLGTILLMVSIVCMGILYAIVRYVMSRTELGCLTYIGTRFIISSFILAVVYSITKNIHTNEPAIAHYWRKLFMWGSLCGFSLFGYIVAAQYGEVTQSAAQASFIISMYVVVIPLAELVLSNFSLPLSWRSWLAIAVDIPGIVLLSGCAETDCFTNFQWGLLLLVVGMLLMVCYVIVSGRAVADIGAMDNVYFCYAFCAIAGTIFGLIFETNQWMYPWSQIGDNWYLILSTSLLETLCSICFTVALAFTSTSRVAIVSSIESLSGAVFGYLLLNETLVGLEYLGGALMLTAVMIELIPCGEQCKEKGEEDEGAVSEMEELRQAPTERSPLLES